MSDTISWHKGITCLLEQWLLRQQDDFKDMHRHSISNKEKFTTYEVHK